MAVTREELINTLIAYATEDYTEDQQSLVEAIVDDAVEEVRNVRYPFGFLTDEELAEQQTAVMTRYQNNIRRIMEYHYDKIGKEGVTTFYESGQTTSWESGGTPNSYFHGIVPLAKLV